MPAPVRTTFAATLASEPLGDTRPTDRPFPSLEKGKQFLGGEDRDTTAPAAGRVNAAAVANQLGQVADRLNHLGSQRQGQLIMIGLDRLQAVHNSLGKRGRPPLAQAI